ncbi:MAG: DNA lyase [Desulfamplus sp.]|nr:DNA lyase [Desulfamplus sp.]
MRIWSIHPSYLDTKGLNALWREGLLAQKVLQGNTVGYTNHPQLTRFKEMKNPVGAVADYLGYVADEADNRGYNFDKSKIVKQRCKSKISVTLGQVKYEFEHLLGKLKQRAPNLYIELSKIVEIEVHPKFEKVSGDVENWEVIKRKHF